MTKPHPDPAIAGPSTNKASYSKTLMKMNNQIETKNL